MKVEALNRRFLSLAIFHESLRFVVAGITTTTVCWGSVIVFVEVFDIHYLISCNLATIIAWMYSFLINKKFVFRVQERRHIAHMTKFIALQVLLLGWTNIVFYFFVGHLGMHYVFVMIGNAVFFSPNKLYMSKDIHFFY